MNSLHTQRIDQLKCYLSSIEALSERRDNSLPEAGLSLWQDDARGLSCFYAPFEHINHDAKIIIVGITPGKTQMNRSLTGIQQALASGQDLDQAIKSVKQFASLSGSMRAKLVDMLNRLGYADLLNIDCCSQLWAERHDLVHFCSVLKYPIFVKGKDYSGQPGLFNVPELKNLLFEQFVTDLKTVNPQAVIVPLGEMVANTLMRLEDEGHLLQSLTRFEGKVISPPHPSGANAESIALILREQYPDLAEYQQQMYDDYCKKQSWLKRPGGKPQEESRYKQARAARWYAMQHVRQAHQL